MSKLLLSSHDGGVWAFQIDSEDGFRDRVAQEFWGKPWAKLDEDERVETFDVLGALDNDGQWTGEQCGMTLYPDGGVGGWRIEAEVIAAAREQFHSYPDRTSPRLQKAVREFERLEQS